jgi:hypothetical protein
METNKKTAEEVELERRFGHELTGFNPAERASKIRRERANRVRRERHQAMRDLGLVRVRGALGGVYYE